MVKGGNFILLILLIENKYFVNQKFDYMHVMKLLNGSRFLFVVWIGALFVLSCEKSIEVQLDEIEPKLVVEGVIENGEYPYVVLSKSTPYFTAVDSSSFSKMFISNALVTVSDGQMIDTLEFDTVMFYPPLRFQGKKIKGQLNTTYTLRIEYENQVYTSVTQILDTLNIDSVRYKYVPGSDSLGYLWFYTQDPVNQTNYYKAFTLDMSFVEEQMLPVWVHPQFSVTDDSYFNGKQAVWNMYNGKNPMRPTQYYEDHKDDWWAFKMGDKIFVKHCVIDYQTFRFWNTTEQVMVNSDNPFAAPTTVQTNVFPDALGSWCGYASSVRYVEISSDILMK